MTARGENRKQPWHDQLELVPCYGPSWAYSLPRHEEEKHGSMSPICSFSSSDQMSRTYLPANLVTLGHRTIARSDVIIPIVAREKSTDGAGTGFGRSRSLRLHTETASQTATYCVHTQLAHRRKQPERGSRKRKAAPKKKKKEIREVKKKKTQPNPAKANQASPKITTPF